MREPSNATAEHARASGVDTAGAFAHADANTGSGAEAFAVAKRRAQRGDQCPQEREGSLYRSWLCKLVWTGISEAQRS